MRFMPREGFAGRVLPVALAITTLGVAFAAPGDLDDSFGGDGVVKVDFLDGDGGARALATQPDGRIVEVGTGGTEGFYVTRRRANGKPDKTFSGDGLKVVAMPPGVQATDVAVTPDGKLVLLGWMFDSPRSAGVARLKPNGRLDKTFSGDGRRTFKITTDDHDANALAVQKDGKIVIAVTTREGSDSRFTVARLKRGGGFDLKFDDDGFNTVAVLGSAAEAQAIAIQPDGRIVAAGWAEVGGPADFALARFNKNGSLDTDSDGAPATHFNEGGTQLTHFDVSDRAHGVAIGPNRKIVAVGQTGDLVAVARYLRTGSSDTSFSGDGKRTIDVGQAPDNGNSVVVQPDNKILITGETSGGHVPYVARLRLKRKLDSTFGDGGVATPGFGNSHSGDDIDLDSKNRVVVASSGLTNDGLRIFLFRMLTGLPQN